MKGVLSRFLLALVLLLPLFVCSGSSLFRQDEACALTLWIIACMLALQGLFGLPIRTKVFSKVDVAVLVFVCYAAGHLLWCGQTRADASDLCKWLALAGLYVYARQCDGKYWVGYALVLSGVLESIVALLQSIHCLDSGHAYFGVTGHFGNPGPLGGYLAVCGVVALGLMAHVWPKREKWLAILLGVSVLFLVIGLWLADSRAAWLAVLVGGASMLGRQAIYRFGKRIGCILPVFIVVLGCLFYAYRPLSVDARMLIARITCTMIGDSPWWGHGIGSFQSGYMFYQAAYFSERTSEPDVQVADNVASPYNEWLHVWVELGGVGVCLLCLVFYFFFRIRGTGHFVRGGLVAWLVFSLFSYPSQVFPLLATGVCLLACHKVERFRVVHWPTGINGVFFVGCMLGAVYGFCHHQFYERLSRNMASLYQEGYSEPLVNWMNANYKHLENNATFRMTYCVWLARCSSHPLDSVRVAHVLPSSEAYCALGDYYLRIQDVEAAKSCYGMAGRMVPNRLLPTYKLWELHRCMQDTVQSIVYARQIIEQPVKVVNSFTINTRRRAREYLEKVSPG